MRILSIIALIVLINTAGYSQSGWFQQETGTDITLRSVVMTDNNTGYAVGGDILIDGPDVLDRGIILKTTNGGVNWFSQTDINFSKILYSIFFIDNQTGYAAGRDGSEFAILKTTNG